jgi:hypothetical protein
MIPPSAVAAVDPHYLRGLVVGGVFGVFGGSTFGLLLGGWLNLVDSANDTPDPAILELTEGGTHDPATPFPRPRHAREAHRSN